MEEKTVKKALSLLGDGIKMLSICTLIICKKSSIKACKDTLRGVWKHPIVALIIIGIMAYQCYIIITQRTERDASTTREYLLEQSLDSMQNVTDITQYRYEHRNDTTTISSRNAH